LVIDAGGRHAHAGQVGRQGGRKVADAVVQDQRIEGSKKFQSIIFVVLNELGIVFATGAEEQDEDAGAGEGDFFHGVVVWRYITPQICRMPYTYVWPMSRGW
jgi:hypothetical protein